MIRSAFEHHLEVVGTTLEEFRQIVPGMPDPLGKLRTIAMIDPEMCFDVPVTAGRGISTAVLTDLVGADARIHFHHGRSLLRGRI